jgi:hypothetical protein
MVLVTLNFTDPAKLLAAFGKFLWCSNKSYDHNINFFRIDSFQFTYRAHGYFLHSFFHFAESHTRFRAKHTAVISALAETTVGLISERHEPALNIRLFIFGDNGKNKSR